jgi:hypothetical protein
MAELENARYPCPACGAPLYGWTAAHDPLDRGRRIVLDRCESCGLSVTRAPAPPDPRGELEPLLRREVDGRAVLVAPNRRSIQGGLGGAQWAGLEPELHRLHLTPESARLLLGRGGLEVAEVRTPFSSRGFRSMLQTLVNAFTLRDNFIRNARAGRVSAGSVGMPAYALDWTVSALVIMPCAIVALPLEAIGAALGRGGVMEVEAQPAGD